MPGFLLIHGGRDSGSTWAPAAGELTRRGATAVAPDLPLEDPTADLEDYARTAAASFGGGGGAVVVAHSWGGFVAPLLPRHLPVALIVLVASVVPAPGEAPDDFWASSGHGAASPWPLGDPETFEHDLPPATRALLRHGQRPQAPRSGRQPWPRPGWPDVPTRALIGRHDRVLPAPWLRALFRDRLGIAAEELDTGHYPMLTHPATLADRLLALAATDPDRE